MYEEKTERATFPAEAPRPRRGLRSVASEGSSTGEVAGSERFLTLDELAEARRIPLGSLYQRSRLNRIPGLHRFGRRLVVDVRRFDEATIAEGIA